MMERDEDLTPALPVEGRAVSNLPWSWTLPPGTVFEEMESGSVVAVIPGRGRAVVSRDGVLSFPNSTFVPGIPPDDVDGAAWDAWVAFKTGAPVPPRPTALPIGKDHHA